MICLIRNRTLLTLVGVLLLALAPLPAQNDDRAALVDQVNEFKRFYPTYKEQAERIEAIRTLDGVDCPEAALTLAKLLSDKDPEIVRAALDVMSKYGKNETLTPVMNAIGQTKDKTIKAYLITVLGKARFVEALPVFEELLVKKKEKDLSIRLRIAEAFGIFGDKKAVPHLLKMLEDKKPQLRIAALDSLAKLGDRARSKPIVPLLQDKDWRVRAAAVKAAGKIRILEAVENLIELLADSAGRIKVEALDALWEITDTDFHENLEFARKQWANLKSLGFKMPSDAEMAKRRAKRKASLVRYKGLKKTTTYHGIPTTSKRLLFIIDVSGSMDDLVVDREKFKEGGYASYQKLEIVKTELIRTLENMDNNTYFNIYAFATKVMPWKKRMVRANIVSRKSAIAWASKLRPLGGNRELPMSGGLGGAGAMAIGKTNTLGALLAAFGLPPNKVPNERDLEKAGKPKDDLDTIFFLTDGRPSTGIFIDRDDILREVAKVNKYRKIVLHAIAIGEFEKSFLLLLARQNGGEFVDLGR